MYKKKVPNAKGKGRGNTKDKFDGKQGRPDSRIAEEKFNDPSWYITREQLAKDVASLSFNNALGAPITIDFDQDGQTSASNFTLNVPGIMTLLTVPTMGSSVDGSSAINIAAKNIYSWVRHQNSGHANYDAPDLMLYLGAMDSVYCMIAYMMRVYGVARVFSQTNRYIGDALISAMGFQPSEIRANLANFRSFINMTITKASAFCTPNVMSVYRRHFWMYSGVYKDEDITKSQMYMYRPAALWQYEETEGVGRLQTINFGTTLTSGGDIQVGTFTLSSFRTLVENTLSKLTASEDINIMSGDILKAYGRENLWVLGLINEDYVVMPVYSAEVLDQIHNTTMVGRRPTHNVVPTAQTFPYTMDAFNIYQDPTIGEGALLCTPQIVGSKHLGYSRLIDFDKEEPAPEDVLVATRNTVMGTPMLIGTGDSRQVVTTLDSFASDLVLYGFITQIENGVANITAINAGDTGYSVPFVNLVTKFKQAPLLYNMSSASWDAVLNGVVGELGNYTVIDYNDLNRMHQSAILAMLGVPFYGVAK